MQKKKEQITRKSGAGKAESQANDRHLSQRNREGISINFAVAIAVAAFTPHPPPAVREMADHIRIPRGAGKSHELSV